MKNTCEVFNHKFCSTEKQFVEALFHPGGTFSGTFKVLKTKVMFYRPNGQSWFCLCFHKGGKLFASVTVLDGGKKWYSYLSSNDQNALGFPESHKAVCDEVDRVLLSLELSTV